MYGTDEMRLENLLSCVNNDDWVDLVRYFRSEDFKRNLETGDEPSQTSLWLTTRYIMKKKVWVDLTSRKVYDGLKRLKSQPLEEGTPPMTEDQRFETVLGPERSGCICGRRAGPKPKTSTVGQRIHAQLERE
eukprot:TRINITY_DN1461_c0_g1_i10.p1 TRINITY_DN1461_c0_g1~~TRINITY_DN1461_c0_g1_i10.p1  ORF type:complete len:132 (-),score=16.29 TRINITY_DN1461_c0_g1_i10:264-659(-)